MNKHLVAALAAGDVEAQHYTLRDFGNALAIIDGRVYPEKCIVWAGPASDRALADSELARLRMRARVQALKKQVTALKQAKQNNCPYKDSDRVAADVLRELFGDAP